MKHYRLMTFLVVILILSFMIAMKIAITTAYERGQKSVTYSCELKDVCTGGYEENGFLSDYEHGKKYQYYKCSVYSGPAVFENDWIIEEN